MGKKTETFQSFHEEEMGELLAKHMARTARTQPAIWRIFAVLNNHLSRKLADKQEQGSFLHDMRDR